jgi:hypothetical protein
MRQSSKIHSLRESLVYVKATSGHRQSYLDTFSRVFGLEPVSGPMNTVVLRRLVAADCLLFATLDENMLGFPAVAAIRSILGRPTVGIFLRPQTCFQTERWYHPVKRYAFRLLRRLPGLTIATITPFTVEPRYAEVAHVGVADPQYWDLQGESGSPHGEHTNLSDDVVKRARGRRILCVLGGLSTDKGLPFLTETLERSTSIADEVFVVVSGRVRPQDSEWIRRLEAAGAFVVNRFIADAELDSLYGIASLVWSCYAPDYDQASGIFGRAIQYGVPPIVREGSLISAFAAANGIDYYSVTYGAHASLADLLLNTSAAPTSRTSLSGSERSALIDDWRRQFVGTIGASLKSVKLSC